MVTSACKVVVSRSRWLLWAFLALLVVVPVLQLAAGVADGHAKQGRLLSVGKVPSVSTSRQSPTLLGLVGVTTLDEAPSAVPVPLTPPFVPPEA